MELAERYQMVLGKIREKISNLTPNQKILTAVGSAAVMGIIITVIIWALGSNYTYLYTNLDPAMTAEITGKLEDFNIPFELGKSGQAILVPEKSLYTARIKLAAEGLPNSQHTGFEIFDKTNLGMTDFVQKINYRRALEGELAKSIQDLNAVKEARVHLVIPEHRLFAKDQAEPTASILLKLQFEGILSREQIRGITHLTASSVEGLKYDKITIIDQHSNLLTPESGENSLIKTSSNQIELQRNVEKYLEQKALSMLENAVGKDNVIVRVSIELDFDQVQSTIESYDPDLTAVRSQERTEEKSADNTGGEQKEETSSQNTSAETIITNYEVSRTVRTIAEGTGNIRHLSVAAMVDGSYVPAPEGSGNEDGMEYVPRSQEELNRLGNIVRYAVGFRADRNDQFEIQNIKFDTTRMI